MKIRLYTKHNKYGGSDFVVLDLDRHEMVAGNTASTCVPLYFADEISVMVAKKTTLREVKERAQGYFTDLGRK